MTVNGKPVTVRADQEAVEEARQEAREAIDDALGPFWFEPQAEWPWLRGLGHSTPAFDIEAGETGRGVVLRPSQQ